MKKKLEALKMWIWGINMKTDKNKHPGTDSCRCYYVANQDNEGNHKWNLWSI